MKSVRGIVGFVLAPLMAPLVFAILISGSSLFYSIDDFVQGFIPIAILGVPLSYLVAVFFGLPMLVFLRWIKKMTAFYVVVSGAIIPPLLLFFLMAVNGASKEEFFGNSLSEYMAMSLCGFIVSAVFWLIAIGRKWQIA